MRAWVAKRYGPPEILELATVDPPVPDPMDVRVRVRATTVNSGDVRIRAANFPTGMALPARLALGWSAPRQPVLGVELAGVVEAVGAAVQGFAPGDRVVGMTGVRMGAHAELCRVRADGCLAKIPEGMGFPEAVALPFGGTTALTFLRTRAKLQAGERLLVIGATGSVGVAVVQVGRLLGAEVTAVCSGESAALAASLGAGRVIDRTVEDPLAGDDVWDVIVDTVGQAPVATLRRHLSPRGRLALVAAGLPEMAQIPWVALTSGQRILAGPSDEGVQDLRDVLGWASEGTYTPVIDQRLPFDQAVEAHRRVDSGRKRGAVVLELP